ncbi:uncharacterized protein LOC129916921 [Episyrphus balteatus]|uniref:uncharacterized protein LOC129916921 n=1 Tax=Episyrphus balteatus TaxID=286459 RepID=UPI002484FDA1|nr:uncharacterized protein LOC129916921 [Episyrphus balteatus]
MTDFKSNHEFEKELMKWNNRFIKIKETFYPHFGRTIVTEKFYSKHDSLKSSDAKKSNVHGYMDEIGKRQVSGPKQIYDKPATENQMYGWLADKAFVYEDEDDIELFCRGRKIDPNIKVQMEINVGIQRDRNYNMLI